MEKQYLMFDIQDARAEVIAEVLSNKTCKKILSLLTEKEMSETDVAKELGIPANTAHYNIQKLVSSGLVEVANKFFWSIKGRKVALYKISNKKVIISPKTSFKGIVPAVIATGIVALGVKIFTGNSNMGSGDIYSASRDVTLSKASESTTYGAEAIAVTMPYQTGDIAVQVGNIGSIAPWSWFLLGAWAALLIFVLFNIRRGSSN